MERRQTFRSGQDIKLWQIYKKWSCTALFPSDDYLSTTHSALHDPPSNPPGPLFTSHHITSSPPLSAFFFGLSLQRQTDLSWPRFKGWEHSRHWRKGRQHPPDHGGGGLYDCRRGGGPEGKCLFSEVTRRRPSSCLFEPPYAHIFEMVTRNETLTSPTPPPTTSWCLRLALTRPITTRTNLENGPGHLEHAATTNHSTTISNQ